MVFSSVSFLYYFLPAVLAIYFLLPKNLKNAFLLLASIVFYFCGEPVYVFLMIGSILSGYLHGLWIEKAKKSGRARLPLVSSIVVGLGLLGFFKYSDFFISNLNALFNGNLALLNLALPIGISFYTFQILSYAIDVYRGNVAAQKNLIDFAAYVSLFPQLIAGPIVRYADVARELKTRTHSFENFAYGVRRFTFGLAKKVLIANTLAELGKTFIYSDEKTVLFYWLAALAFTLQVYFDFSGYSDMAIGMGRMFGFRFLENFNYPFISQSAAEFWRRWHMSLGTWFRDYLYIPLGGNRVSIPKWIRNILIVWLLTGLWHGAEWNFVVWGLFYAVLLICEKLFLQKALSRLPKAFRHIYVIFITLVSFTIFNADGLPGVRESLSGMFGGLGLPLSNFITLYYLRSYAVVLLIAALASTPLVPRLIARLRPRFDKALNALEPAVLAAMLIMVTGYLVDGSFNPFLYFRF